MTIVIPRGLVTRKTKEEDKFKEEIAPGVSVVLVSSKKFNENIFKKNK